MNLTPELKASIRDEYFKMGYVVVKDTGVLDDLTFGHYDEWIREPAIYKVATHPFIGEIVNSIYDKEMIPFDAAREYLNRYTSLVIGQLIVVGVALSKISDHLQVQHTPLAQSDHCLQYLQPIDLEKGDMVIFDNHNKLMFPEEDMVLTIFTLPGALIYNDRNIHHCLINLKTLQNVT